jgi:NADPH:quinone reductase-like Zn-dependent oxidoreductase
MPLVLSEYKVTFFYFISLKCVMNKLKEKTALITGGSSGIGLAAAN